MKRQNLHCHTTFDDGKNSPEEMVLAAIGAGLAGIGVSLHCPIDGGRGLEAPQRGTRPRFLDEMRRLREKYADKIAVWCGLEYDMDAARRSVPPYDYIIGSCHMLSGIAIDNDPETAAHLIAFYGGAERAAAQYFARLSAMADYPEIAIVGHFDLPTKYNERAHLYNTAAPAYRDAAFAAMESSTRRARSLRSTPAPSAAAGAPRPTRTRSCCAT